MRGASRPLGLRDTGFLRRNCAQARQASFTSVSYTHLDVYKRQLQDHYAFEGMTVDVKAREVSVGGRPVELTYKEFELLKMLIGAADRALGREELLQKVWGYDFMGESRTLDMHVGTLRQKLGDDPVNPKYIKTVRGVGYRFIGRRDGK